MNKTHYELLLENFPFVEESFQYLKKELLRPGFSFEDYISTEFIKNIMGKSFLKYNSKNTMTNLQLLFHLYSFHIGMGRVYEIKDNMAEMLLNTKLDIDCGLVKSPFEEILIMLPENQKYPTLQVPNNETGKHNLNTIYVNFYEKENSKIIKLLCVGKPNKNSLDYFDDAILYFKLDLNEGKVSKSITEQLENWKENPLYKVFSNDTESKSMSRIFHFVLNVLLYITSTNCDIRLEKASYDLIEKRLKGLKCPGKIRKFENKLKKESKLSRYIVGGSFSLSQQEKDLYNKIRTGRHSIRYPVGGHWRMQWHGHAENKYQKQTWIRPHFRGPELAELIKNIGVLK